MFKKIVNILKTMFYGITPLAYGGCTTLSIFYIVRHLLIIPSTSGWTTIAHFSIMFMEIVLSIIALYELGIMRINSNNWILHMKHKHCDVEHNNNSSTSDSETSDEATNTSSEPVTDKRRSKKSK